MKMDVFNVSKDFVEAILIPLRFLFKLYFLLLFVAILLILLLSYCTHMLHDSLSFLLLIQNNICETTITYLLAPWRPPRFQPRRSDETR